MRTRRRTSECDDEATDERVRALVLVYDNIDYEVKYRDATRE